MRKLLTVAFATLLVAGCSMMGSKPAPIATVAQVDLPKFMGDWYVIAAIPLYPERKAFNAIESYKLEADGSIATTFRQRKGGFDEPVTTYHPTGYVKEGSGNATWGMQFLWPFKGEYLIAFVEPDYSATIVARSKRDYVWLMARQPTISAASYQRYEKKIAEMGYDVSKIRRVPQQWPETAAK